MTNVTEMPTAVITAELEAFKSKYKVPPDVALTISSVFYNTEEDTGVPARVWVAEAMKDVIAIKDANYQRLVLGKSQ